jgi:DNA invertase Pin-like site-specific DNA recombinase
MAKIGYARVSSKEQHLDRQLAALKDVDKLFTDKLSGANTNRPELQKMLAYIREGDIVMVTELDRLVSVEVEVAPSGHLFTSNCHS